MRKTVSYNFWVQAQQVVSFVAPVLHCLTLCMLENCACFLSSADFLEENIKKIFQDSISVNFFKQFGSSSFVGPDLGPDCLQRLSTDSTSRQRFKEECFKAS